MLKEFSDSLDDVFALVYFGVLDDKYLTGKEERDKRPEDEEDSDDWEDSDD